MICNRCIHQNVCMHYSELITDKCEDYLNPVEKLEKIKEEIQGLIDFEESCCGNATLGYECLGVINKSIAAIWSNGIEKENKMNKEYKTAEEYRQRMIEAFHNAGCDYLIAVVSLPTEKEFTQLEWLLKHELNKRTPEELFIEKLEEMKEQIDRHIAERKGDEYESDD